MVIPLSFCLVATIWVCPVSSTDKIGMKLSLLNEKNCIKNHIHQKPPETQNLNPTFSGFGPNPSGPLIHVFCPVCHFFILSRILFLSRMHLFLVPDSFFFDGKRSGKVNQSSPTRCNNLPGVALEQGCEEWRLPVSARFNQRRDKRHSASHGQTFSSTFFPT